MSITGRTTERWGRDRSARWDPGPTNRTRSYPPRPETREPDVPETKEATLPGRPGAAERTLGLGWLWSRDRGGMILDIEHVGWYASHIELDERQARFLRDTLNEWLSE